MSSDNTALCLYDVSDGVATITFNRPDQMNGMIGNMEVEYFTRLREAEADPDVRAIVITGAGRAFCPGADLAHQAGEGDEPMPNQSIPTTTPLDISKPIIAAINGACAGVGMAYALQADIRFAARGAKFTSAFARRGLIAEYGLSWLVHSIAGRAVALDVLMSARVFLAEEAHEMGLVHRVLDRDDVLPEALAYAADLARNVSPASMAVIKRQVTEQPAMTPHAAMAESDDLMAQSLRGIDVGEGVSSFLQRRQADFPPLGEGTQFEWPS